MTAGAVYFTNELACVSASGQSDTVETIVTVDGAEILKQEFGCADSGEVIVTSIGSMIRDHLRKIDKSVADASIKIGSASISFKALRCDRPYFEDAVNFCKNNFLSDVGVMTTFHQGIGSKGVSQFAFKIKSYDPATTPATAKVYREARGVQDYESIQVSSENGLCTYSPTITAWMIQNTGTPIVYGDFSAVLTAGSRQMPIEAKTVYGGASFVFENSFGIPEVIYIPGIISQAPEMNYTEVMVNRRLQSVDRSISTVYTVTAENAPLWLFEAAKLLTLSENVEIADTPYIPQILGTGRKVIIAGVSGTGHDANNSLCNIKLTFKYAET